MSPPDYSYPHYIPGPINIDAVLEADTKITIPHAPPGQNGIWKTSVNPGGPIPSELAGTGKYITVETTLEPTEITWPLTLRIYYTDSEISGIDEDSLQIYYWNPSASKWQAEDSTVDTANNYIEAELDHLSTFSPMGNPSPAPSPKPPAVGGGPALPVNLLAVLAPWIALGLIVAGTILVVKLRSHRWGE